MLNLFQHLLSMIFIKYCRNRFFGRCPQNDGRTKSDKMSEYMVILSKAKNLSEEKFLLGQDPTYDANLKFTVIKKNKEVELSMEGLAFPSSDEL